MGSSSSAQKQMSSVEDDVDDHKISSNDARRDDGHVDRDDVRGLVKGLESAISEGDVQLAGANAAQLARLKLNCQIKLLDAPKKAMESHMRLLRVTVEDVNGTEVPLKDVEISLDSSVKELKQKVESLYGYPCERQSVFFKNKVVEDEHLSLRSHDYESGAIIVIKKEIRKSQGTAGKFNTGTKINTDGKSNKGEDMVIGWACPSCTFVNAAHRPGCEVCSSERPPSYVIPRVAQAKEHERLQREKEEWAAFEREEELNRKRNWEAYKRLDNQNLVFNTIPFECAICFNEVEVKKGVELRNCLHHFCFECLSENVNACDDVVVKCPYKDDNYACDSALEEREIRGLVNEATVERLLSRSMATVETTSNDSFHCKTPDCRGWCFYGEGVVNYVCPLCKHDNCISCNVIHEGQNCKEYQDQLETLARTDEEAKKTKEGLEAMLTTGVAMRCPSCAVIIIKNGGCDGLSCGNCKIELCWATKGPRWGPKGRGDTSAGCRCNINGARCHPKCQNCH